MKIVEKTKNKVLIEHNNQRYIITYDLYNQYQDGKLTPDDLTELGIPSSVRWSEFITVDITEQKIEEELHRHGIHTIDDLLKNVQAVNGAIFASLGITASILHKRVKQNQRVGDKLNG